jgi:tyrosyl-tRNA synthetase
MSPMSELLDDLVARDLVHDTTDRAALAARLDEDRPLALYYGCDPTAPSLHVGNLIGLVLLRRFQDAGHHPIALAGGATGMVGDPSGRSDERNLLDEDVLSANVAAITAQMSRILDLEADGAHLVDNRDWTKDLGLLEFLRDVGKHATVNQMVARESVRIRMQSEQGISFTEFSYMLLQANDYLWLHDHHGCELQVGGSDQWGNILSGVDLIRRVRGTAVHALCWPLLTAGDGSKLGKTTGARTWLDPQLTSYYAFFQHWMQTDDADLRRMLNQMTLLPLARIDEVVAGHEAAPQRRAGQRVLAHEVTALVHGEPAARTAAEASEILFGGDPRSASAGALALVAAEVPRTALEPGESLSVGVALPAVLVRAGLAASLSEARRQLGDGAVSVNGAKVPADRALRADDVLHGAWILLRKGKREWAVVEAGAAP